MSSGQKESLTIKRLKSLWKGKRWVLILVAVGILLLLLSGQNASKETKTTTPDAGFAEAYRQSLTEELQALCNRVSGVADVSILLTLEGTEQAEYASGRYSSDSTLEGYTMPKVTGVAVVCRGGNVPERQAELVSLVRAALGIPASRIHVCGSD